MSQASMEPSGEKLQATVTQVTPLMIRVDGAVTACPAAIVDQFSIVALGDRCLAEDRAPRPPLVVDGIKFDEEA